ncbi:MAG TPA: PHB depolymerase family esterase [Burkholderiaceae bacterium]|nr:PHB depolymerase family esterase [Burkholderiaceae bacterium]
MRWTRTVLLAGAARLIPKGHSGSRGAARVDGRPAATDRAQTGLSEGLSVEVALPRDREEAGLAANARGITETHAAAEGAVRSPPHEEAAADEFAPDTVRSAAVASEWIAGNFQNAAGQRAYKLYVPSCCVGQPLPLIVMLHGCRQTPDDLAVGTRMNALAEEGGCFVLYPAQSETANHSRCWNWYLRENQVRDAGEPSIIADMTRTIIDRYGADSRSVFVAGLSAGGAMAAIMGVTYPDLYAAVGIHSGLACGSAHDLPSALAVMKGVSLTIRQRSATERMLHSTPTIVFHGDRDRTVHPRNGIDAISRSAHWEGGDGGQVLTEEGRAPGGHTFTRTLHRDAGGRVLLEHWLVHGGGHAWFGGSRAGSYTDPRGPDAATEMVRFFLQHTSGPDRRPGSSTSMSSAPVHASSSISSVREAIRAVS